MKEGKKQNPLGFTDDQLEVVLDFCRVTNTDPRIPYTRFHRRYSPYSRRQSTVDLLHKAYRNMVLSGPFLFCNSGIDVMLVEDCGCDPHELYEEKKDDPDTYFAIALYGDIEFICFHKGATILQHAAAVVPDSIQQGRLKDLYFDEAGELQRDPYPHRWDALDWKIFNNMRVPRSVTFRQLGKKLDISWVAVKNRYNNLVKQCKLLSCFWPLGYEGYLQLVVSFKTKYEIGLVKALKKLGRTTCLYKFDDTILLFLFLLPVAFSNNDTIKNFKKLEKIGIIYDLRISSPLTFKNIFV